MSSQPSTTENLRAAASTATHTIAEILDPQETERKKTHTTDAQGTVCKKGSYKDQLNEAAYGGAKGLKKEEGFVEKAASYVPGLAAVTGYSTKTPEVTAPVDDGQPPTRPDHDVQVEEFLKGQYKSKSGQDMPSVEEGK